MRNEGGERFWRRGKMENLKAIWKAHLKSLEEVVREYLQANGYDGLCYPDLECGCAKDDLFPCGEPDYDECKPAYLGSDDLYYLTPQKKRPPEGP
jgi:hypothetical protein